MVTKKIYNTFMSLARQGLGRVFTIDNAFRNPGRDTYTLLLQNPIPSTDPPLPKKNNKYELQVEGKYLDKHGIRRGYLDRGAKIFVDLTQNVYVLHANELNRLRNFFLGLQKKQEKQRSSAITEFQPEKCSLHEAINFFNSIVLAPPEEIDRETLEKTRALKNNPQFGRFFSEIPKSAFEKAFTALDMVDIEDADFDPTKVKVGKTCQGYNYLVKMIAGRLLQKFGADEGTAILGDKLKPIVVKVNELAEQSRKLSPTKRIRLRKKISKNYPRLRKVCYDFVFKDLKNP